MRQAQAKLHALREKIKEGEAVLELVRINGREVAIKEANLNVRNAEVRRAEADLADLVRKLELMTIVSPVQGTVAKKVLVPEKSSNAANLFSCLSTPAVFGWKPMWKRRRSAS
jgi:multidrug resistance efflux pump